MQPRACLDAGPIQLHFLTNTPQKIEELFQNIQNEKIIGVVPEPILVEVFKHLCVSQGKEMATSSINAFFSEIKVSVLSISKARIIAAGKLKCQYREILSYNDAILIATALQEKAIVHTTEKTLPKIQGLTVVKYEF